MSDFQDWQSEAQVAVKLGTTDLTGTGLAKDVTVTGVSKTTDIAALHASGKTIAAEVGTTDLTPTGLNKEATQTTLSKTTDITALHATGKTIAVDISNTGTPLLRQSNVLASATAQTLAGGATATILATQAFAQPAVQIFMNCKMPLNSGTVPFARLTLNWINVTTGLILSSRQFWSAAGNNAQMSSNLLAPARGDELQVNIVNLDPAITLTYDFVIVGITHFVVDDDFMNTSGPSVNGFTAPGFSGNAGILASTNPSIAPNSSITRLIPACSRKVAIHSNNDVAGGNLNILEVHLTDPASLFGLANAAVTFYERTGIAAGSQQYDEVVLPHGPTLLTMTNTQGVNTITPTVIFVYEKLGS